MTHPTRTLSDKVAKALAFDIAADYFTDAQLARRYDLAPGQLAQVKQNPALLKLVDEFKRQIEDEGVEFLVKARQYAMNALRSLYDIATDDEVSASTRRAAAKDVCELAGMKRKGDEPAAPPAIIINTNLALNLPTEDTKGTYVARARSAILAPPVPVLPAGPPERHGRWERQDGADLI